MREVIGVAANCRVGNREPRRGSGRLPWRADRHAEARGGWHAGKHGKAVGGWHAAKHAHAKAHGMMVPAGCVRAPRAGALARMREPAWRFIRRTIAMAIVCAALMAAGRAAQAAKPRVLSLHAGETRVLTHAGVSRVAVGDGQVVQAIAEGGEVILFARDAGVSSLHVWANKRRYAYSVEVAAAGASQLRSEVNALLARVPGARSSVVGDKIVIEGQDLSDAGKALVAALAARYPQVLDLTGSVGWDRMVLLDVQVVELPRSRLRELGMRWDGATQGGARVGLALDAAAASRLSARPGESPVDVPLRAAPLAGFLGMNALLSARLDLLAQSGEAVVLAQPQLLARSGATAEFLAGGEVPYTTVNKNGESRTMFKPYGVALRITPTISASGAVRSHIEVEASSIDSSITVQGGPALRTRRASTEFNVRSGHTLVLGGFLSRERSSELTGLPGLSELPWVGGLFGSRRTTLRETELAIFVTPLVVTGDHAAMRLPVQRGREALARTFPQEPRMIEPAHRHGGAAIHWNPHAGAGSQWEADQADQADQADEADEAGGRRASVPASEAPPGR